ncbi:MAG: thiol-disulfide isomerase [Acidobacteria bacterium]|nr:thiol-disulfide isomerase [Acidobacteriota bacterium]
MRTGVVVAGCLVAAGPAAAAADGATVFSTDVAPILMRHCVGCHRPGEIAPMSLLTYREARPWARSIQRVVSSGRMPPWFANPEHGKWANDARLSPEEIETIVAWVEGGAKPGDPARMPEQPRFRDGWQLGEPDYVIELPPVTVPATGPDLAPTQLVRLDIPERRWVRAVEFQPGDRTVNHHQIAFMGGFGGMGAGNSQERPDGERRGKAPGVDVKIFAVWAAGAAPTVFPDGAGRWVDPGTLLLLNQHYHPNGDSERTDRTRIGLFFGEGPLEIEVEAILAGRMDFTIPAGAPDHRIVAHHELGADSRIVSYFAHMHMRGRAMSFTAVYPDGSREILLDVPEYDFDWQLFYYPEAPKVLPAGSVVEVVARYDNSATNPRNPDPTLDIGFGFHSTDEMMVGIFELIEVASDESAESDATGGE